MSVGTIGDLACTYATLLLHEEGIPVTADKISAVVKAANVKVEAYWPGVFAKLVERKSVENLIMKVGSGGGCAAGAPGVASVTFGPAPAAAGVTKKEEAQVEESDEEDYSLNLFD